MRRVHGSRRSLRAASAWIVGLLSWERPLARELLVGAVFSIGVGGVFFAIQLGFDARNAERAEVLANVTYIRETIRDGGRMDFRNMNLRGANLSGLDFGCDLKSIGDQLVPVSVEQVYEHSDSCATLSGSDLTDARLDDTDLTGAIIEDAIFAPTSARGTVLVGTQLRGTFDVTFEFADLRGAQFRIGSGNSGVLPWPRSRIDVTGSTLVGAMVSDQDPSGDIYHADISLTHSRVTGIYDYRPDVGSGRAIDDWGDTWDPDRAPVDIGATIAASPSDATSTGMACRQLMAMLRERRCPRGQLLSTSRSESNAATPRTTTATRVRSDRSD